MKKIIIVLLLAISLGLSGCAYQRTARPTNVPAPVNVEKAGTSTPVSSGTVSSSSVASDVAQPNVPTSSPDWTANGRPSIAIFKNIYAGKPILGMTVTGFTLLDYQRIVKFSGKTRLTGDFKEGYGDEGGDDCSGAWFTNLDAASEKKMPKFSPGDKSNFCLSDSPELFKDLYATATSGRATIDIDDFNLVYCECGAWSSAKLVEVVSINKK